MLWEKSERFVGELNIKKADADILSESKELANFFENSIKVAQKEGIRATDIANHIINKKVDYQKSSLEEITQAIKTKSTGIIDSEEELEKIAKEVISENPNFVDTYKAGKTTVIMALVGAVMKKTSGKANAQKIRQILEELLS